MWPFYLQDVTDFRFFSWAILAIVYVNIKQDHCLNYTAFYGNSHSLTNKCHSVLYRFLSIPGNNTNVMSNTEAVSSGQFPALLTRRSTSCVEAIIWVYENCNAACCSTSNVIVLDLIYYRSQRLSFKLLFVTHKHLVVHFFLICARRLSWWNFKQDNVSHNCLLVTRNTQLTSLDQRSKDLCHIDHVLPFLKTTLNYLQPNPTLKIS